MAIKPLQKNIPKGWTKKQIKDLLDYERPDKYIVESDRYISSGTPVLTANKSFILGYTDEKGGIYKNTPAIIFDDFTTDSKFVDFPFKIKSSAIKILKDKEGVDLRFVYEKMKSINFPTGSHKRYYISQYQNMEVLVPLLPEQKKIAEILSAVDEEIQKTDEIISVTEKLKSGLMRKLFTHGIGHTKFKKTKLGEIPNEWKVKAMKDICSVRQGLQIAISERFKEPGENRLVYITLKYLRDLESPEYIDNPSKRVICKKDDVLMTRTGNTGTVITNVEGVFHNNFFLVDYDRDQVNRDFFVYYLLTPQIQQIILDRAGTTTIPDLNHGDFYSIPFTMPPKKEQKEIVDILSSVDEKISVNQGLKEKLALLKKGLMLDLLNGSKRVNIS